jgi:hypothetical protein
LLFHTHQIVVPISSVRAAGKARRSWIVS